MNLENAINNKLYIEDEWWDDIPSIWEEGIKISQAKDGESIQKISSANTSRAQLPKTLKAIQQLKMGKDNPVLLDLGCGKDNIEYKKELEAEGAKYFGYDPFNQPLYVNLETIHNCKNGGADLVTINNVLNAMSQKEIRKLILEQAANAINEKSGMVMILTYEGELTSKEKADGLNKNDMQPRETKHGWQNRQKTEFYLDEVKEVFPNVEIMNVASAKLIVASKNPELDLDLKNKLKEIQKEERNKRLKLK